MLRTSGKVCLLSLAILLSIFLIACGGGGGNNSSSTPTVTGLVVTPTTVSLPNGTTQQLSVTATYSDGSSRNVTSQAAWSVSPSTVAKVSSSGLLTSTAQGTGTITATMSSQSAHSALTVQAPAMTAIQITPSSLSVPLGSNQQLTATATYTDGSTGNVTSSVTWSSNASSIATVSAAGLVQSVAKGSFTISAVNGSTTGSLTGAVGNAIIHSIQVSPSSASIPNGANQTFSATAVYTDGSTQDVTTSATWLSSNTGVASMSSSGIATSAGQGSSQISASYQSLNASAVLTVGSASIKSIQVSPSTASMAKGTNLQLSATATLTDGSNQDVTHSVTWSSSGSSVCTVSSGALVLAVGTGTCTATATSGSVTGSATLSITAATLTGITITPPNPSVNSGGSLQLKATGTFSDGTTQDMTASLVYVSSKPLVALVTPGGLLQGLAPGTTTITASLGSVSTSFSVTVNPATLQGITIGLGPITLVAGLSAQLTATGTYSDGSTQDLSATVAWSSSASAIASISTSGSITGLVVGSATVTATLGSVSGSTTVTVSPATVVSISVNPVSVTLAAGQSQAFTATATLTDGTTTDVTASVHWSIANPLLASISNTLGTTGLLNALLPGSSTVTATLGSVSGTGTLYVNAASLVGITVGPNGLSLALGITSQLTATGTYSDGSTPGHHCLSQLVKLEWFCEHLGRRAPDSVGNRQLHGNRNHEWPKRQRRSQHNLGGT